MNGASYHGIGRKIVTEITLDSLSHSDQVNLLGDLLRATGIMNVLFNTPDADMNARNSEAFRNRADAYVKEKT